MAAERELVGPLEAALLNVLWSSGPVTIAELVERLPEGERRHYNTCATVIRRLVDRGLVTAHTDGRPHRFEAAVERDELGRRYLDVARREIFGGSFRGTLSALLGDARESLSADELERLRAELREWGEES